MKPDMEAQLFLENKFPGAARGGMLLVRIERACALDLVPPAPPGVLAQCADFGLLLAVQGNEDGSYGLAFQHAPQAHQGAAVRAASRVADGICAPRRPNWCRRRRRRWW